MIHLADILQSFEVVLVNVILQVFVVPCVDLELQLHLIDHSPKSFHTQSLLLLVFVLSDDLKHSLAQVDIIGDFEKRLHLLVDVLLVGHDGLVLENSRLHELLQLLVLLLKHGILTLHVH